MARPTAAGLFAGIGGIERGLQLAGFDTRLLCECDPSAVRVLRSRFPGAKLIDDIRGVAGIPEVALVAAGFPCQDLSQVGRKKGVRGSSSRLVTEVFRLVASMARRPSWLLLENVPFMLSLDTGRAISLLVKEIERLGYRWAYRIIDSRAFGLPQRRRRVFFLASQTEDPRPVLLGQDRGRLRANPSDGSPCGFYWTEGNRGTGWAVDAVPALKGGSGLTIPSQPAIWFPDEGVFGTPDIRDAERLQGFRAGWTSPADHQEECRRSYRWGLLGNAVSVPVARWLGERLLAPTGHYDATSDQLMTQGHRWPSAAWGENGKAFVSAASEWPVSRKNPGLKKFLRHPVEPLSLRAARGFLNRLEASNLKPDRQFVADLGRYVGTLERQAA